MLLFKNEFIEAINSCPWLKNCGECSCLELGFEIVLIPDRQEVVKRIAERKWEDLCLRKQGDLTAFLCVHCKDEYQQWNNIVDIVKEKYMDPVIQEIKSALNQIGLNESVLPNVQWDILSLFMASYYSDYYSDEFYEKMLRIYLSGHMTCGWTGGLKDGKFLVY